MSGIINLDRDMTWIRPQSPALDWSAESDFNPFLVSTDGSVSQRHTFARSSLTGVSTGAGMVRAIGCMILEPIEEATPYRVKIAGNNEEEAMMLCGFGYGPASPSAGDVQVDNPISLGVGRGVYSDIVCIRPQDTADPYVGRPLCFWMACGQTTGTDVFHATISVQRLISKPDAYSTSVR